MKNILVIRMSALGDVAMTVPVIYSVAKNNPDITFTVLTQPFSANFFINPPENVKIFKADTKNRYKGSKGIIKLCKDLSAHNFDGIVDLHNVIRSKAIRLFFKLKGVKTVAINKGRKEKKHLIATDTKRKKQLKSSFERYADAFRKMGFRFTLDFISVYPQKPAINQSFIPQKTGKWVGIAPFAKHAGKIYPLKKIEEIIAELSSKPDISIFLFGGGDKEKRLLDLWQEKYPNTYSLAGKIKITEEIELMSHLDVMLSMDSANMHLASLVGTPVVSVWGATHPYAGFLGYNQKKENAVGLPLECRPCSIFGNKACIKGDYECLNNLSYKDIIARIYAILDEVI